MIVHLSAQSFLDFSKGLLPSLVRMEMMLKETSLGSYLNACEDRMKWLKLSS
jgi:hypothetical protein